MGEVAAMPEEIKIGDLVWAKMKGFSPWPGRVSAPRSFVKRPSKKTGIHFIFFFGTKNFAWIEEINIKPYHPFKEKLVSACKAPGFKEAVQGIEEYIERTKANPDYDPEKELDDSLDASFDKLRESSPERSPKKTKKSTGQTKRSSTSSSATKTSAKKTKIYSFEENGESPSFTNTNHVTKNYEELLNRPSVIEIPEMPAVDINNISETLRNKNISASQLRFGFLGLGIMGSGMVNNLINSGHKVNLWNRTAEKCKVIENQAKANNCNVVETYQTPCDVVENSDIIFCCVSDPRASKDIVFGNCGVLQQAGGSSLSGKGYVEMTSIDAETSKDICNVIISKGGRYLEAQIQGSKKEASEGTLIVLGAGDKTLFDECQSCFKAIGRTAFFLGDVGYATKMNLVLQVMNGIALAGIAEGFALADRSGLSPKDVLEIFSLTNLSCPALKDKAEIIVNNDFSNCQQPLQHMQKDLKLSLELADSLQQPLLLAATANEVFKHARRLGYNQHDSAVVYMRARF